MMQSRKLLMVLPVLLLAASCNRDPKVQAQRYLENGNKFFAREKYKEASIMYRRALLKDQRFGEAYYRLGLTDLKLAAYGEAIKMLRRAVELQPYNTDAATKLADLFLLASTQDKQHSKELRKEVRDLARGLLTQNPDSYDGRRIQGQMALLEGDAKSAVEEFEQANKTKPYQPHIYLTYFQALVMAGRPADAERIAREMIAREKTYTPIYDILYLHFVREKKIDQAEQVLRQKVDNNPTSPSHRLQLAGHYFMQSRPSDMEAALKPLSDEKAFPQGHLMTGDFFFYRIRQYDRAEQEYQAGIKSMPNDKPTYQKRLVELLATSGKTVDANNVLATILKENPKDNDAMAMRAAMMLTSGNREELNLAVNDLQSLVTRNPTNHLLRFNLARGLVGKGEIEQARLQLDESIKLRPDFMAAREMRGRIYLARNDAPKALKEADEIIALDPNNGPAHLIRSSALLTIGDRDKAREELDLIIKANPNNPDARAQVGYLAWQDKDYKKAEQIFSEMYKQNPNDLRGFIGVVELAALQGRMPEAIAEVEKALARDPGKKQLQVLRANLLVRSNRIDEAVGVYQNLSNADPKNADLWVRLGQSFRLKGDLNAALEAFKRASQASPGDANALLQIALLMENTGKRDQAKPIYEQILKLEPDHFVALNNLAYIKAEEGTDLDQALAMAQRALQKYPSAHEISDTLGWIYIKKNLSEDAVRVFSELVKNAPTNPTFRYHYAMALQQKGDRPRARKELEEALKNKPSRVEEQKIRNMLNTV
jgi:tetratricopeptide (TPR) repeat protein